MGYVVGLAVVAEVGAYLDEELNRERHQTGSGPWRLFMSSRADRELLVLRGLPVLHCDVAVCLMEAGDC
jgi:hypothetical protein